MKRLPNLKQKAKIKIVVKYYVRKVLGYLLFAISLFFFSWLLNKEYEFLLIMCGYCATRFVMPRIYHFNSTIKCVSVSSATFMLGIAILCITTNLSLIWCVGVGCIIPLIMYAEYLLFCKSKGERERLIERCKELGYNERKTQRYACKRASNSEVYA